MWQNFGLGQGIESRSVQRAGFCVCVTLPALYGIHTVIFHILQFPGAMRTSKKPRFEWAVSFDLPTFSLQISPLIRSPSLPPVHVARMRKSIPIESGHFFEYRSFHGLDSAINFFRFTFRLRATLESSQLWRFRLKPSSKARLLASGKNQDQIRSLSPPWGSHLIGRGGRVWRADLNTWWRSWSLGLVIDLPLRLQFPQVSLNRLMTWIMVVIDLAPNWCSFSTRQLRPEILGRLICGSSLSLRQSGRTPWSSLRFILCALAAHQQGPQSTLEGFQAWDPRQDDPSSFLVESGTILLKCEDDTYLARDLCMGLGSVRSPTIGRYRSYSLLVYSSVMRLRYSNFS
jgi:hypothetical protein